MKNKKYTKISIVLAMAMSISVCTLAQWKDPSRFAKNDTCSSPKYDYHLTLGSGVISNGFDATAYTAISPSFHFKVTPKLNINTGLTLLSDLSPHGMQIGNGSKDIPTHSPTTQMLSGYVQAEYQADSNLYISGTAFYIGGTLSPAFSLFGCPREISSYGGAATINYKTKNNNTISINVAVIKNNKDMLPLYGNYHHMSSFSPFNYYYNPFIRY